MSQSNRPNTPDSKPAESREMFTEISSLVASVAKALALPEAEAAAAIERGDLTLRLERDANGNAFVAAEQGAKSVRIYQGAIKR